VPETLAGEYKENNIINVPIAPSIRDITVVRLFFDCIRKEGSMPKNTIKIRITIKALISQYVILFINDRLNCPVRPVFSAHNVI